MGEGGLKKWGLTVQINVCARASVPSSASWGVRVAWGGVVQLIERGGLIIYEIMCDYLLIIY